MRPLAPAGAITFPGSALIDTLPLVLQVVVLSPWSQYGRAAVGLAVMSAATVKLVINSADLP